MTNVYRRLVQGRRGMAPMQTLLILAAAFVIIAAIKGLSNTTYNISQTGINGIFGS